MCPRGNQLCFCTLPLLSFELFCKWLGFVQHGGGLERAVRSHTAVLLCGFLCEQKTGALLGTLGLCEMAGRELELLEPPALPAGS